jgi:hypothetical protein
MIPAGLNIVKADVYNVAERLKAMDNKLFVSRDGVVYTIWRENGDQFPERILDVHCSMFDGRVIVQMQEMDVWAHPDMFAEMDRHNDEVLRYEQEFAEKEAEYAAREMSKVGTVQHFAMGVKVR